MEQECFAAGLAGEAQATEPGAKGGSCSGESYSEGGALSSLGIATCRNRTRIVFLKKVKKKTKKSIDTITAAVAYGLIMRV